MGRLNEAFSVVSSAASIAMACGLDEAYSSSNESSGFGTAWDRPLQSEPISHHLLPSTFDKDEMEDRKNLACAVFMADRTLTLTWGFPSTFKVATSRMLDSRHVNGMVSSFSSTLREFPGGRN